MLKFPNIVQEGEKVSEVSELESLMTALTARLDILEKREQETRRRPLRESDWPELLSQQELGKVYLRFYVGKTILSNY